MRIREVITYEDGKALAEIALASTETKPTDGLATGSTITEADTGKTFVLDEDSATWTEYTSGGGGGGGDEWKDMLILDVEGGNTSTTQTLIIPEGATKVRQRWMQGLTAFLNIDLPSTITSMNNNAFYSASGVKSLIIRAVTPPNIVGGSLSGNMPNCPIYVPAESVDAYKTDSQWSSLASKIQAIPE